MVHSYCWVHHLLWYTYGLMFYCLVWFTFTVCFISGYGSLSKCDCSTHSGTLRFQWWISFFQVQLPCMIIRCTRFTPRHWFNLSVRFTFFLCNNFEKWFAHNHYFYYPHPWLTQTSWLNHCRTGSLLWNWFIHLARFT